MPIFDLVGRYYNFPLKLDNGHKSAHCQKYKCGIKNCKEPDNVIIICKRSSIIERWKKFGLELITPNKGLRMMTGSKIYIQKSVAYSYNCILKWQRIFSFIIESFFSKLQLLNHNFLKAYLSIFEARLLNLPIYIGQLINPPNI